MMCLLMHGSLYLPELCGSFSSDHALLLQVLGCLQNLMLDINNALRLVQAQGHKTLLGLLEENKVDSEEAILHILCNLAGPEL